MEETYLNVNTNENDETKGDASVQKPVKDQTFYNHNEYIK
jgi:hypothetical protein